MRCVHKLFAVSVGCGILLLCVLVITVSQVEYVPKTEVNRYSAYTRAIKINDTASWRKLVVRNPVSSTLRICCMVMTTPTNLQSKARYVKMTWGRRCEETVYISSQTNTTFPTVGINTEEGRKNLLYKAFGGLRFVGLNLINDCDWFFKGDDDTYMIVENLRHFLKDYDTQTPIYFGHHFKTIVKQGYSSGGSGYVMSKEAMRRFVNESYKVEKTWTMTDADDAAHGQVMENVGAKIGKSVDSKGRSRFHCLDPGYHLSGNYPDWYYAYDANGARSGIPNLSEFPISFHYVPGVRQLELEYFLYHAGIYHEDQPRQITKEHLKQLKQQPNSKESTKSLPKVTPIEAQKNT